MLLSVINKLGYRGQAQGDARRRGNTPGGIVKLRHYALAFGGVLAAVFCTAVSPVMGQSGAAGGEWSSYGGDLGHTRYAPLDQITADNFDDLEVAWRFKTDNLGPMPEFRFQSTPLVIGGKLYSTGGSRRAVVALDAATGELNWVYSLDEGERGEAAPRQLSGRGLAYWSGVPDRDEARIIYVTPMALTGLSRPVAATTSHPTAKDFS